jgi:MORN repeat
MECWCRICCSGGTYHGDYANGSRSGNGTCTFANGDVYEGKSFTAPTLISAQSVGLMYNEMVSKTSN